jgi:hypothetical protein
VKGAIAERIAGLAVDPRPSGRRDGEQARIYIAGPFTQHLSFAELSPPIDNDVNDDLEPKALIGQDSGWRRTLLAAASALEQLGWSVFLPHRDVSEWGERDITPGDVARECLEAVMASDAVVAFMGESFGTHVEVGVAVGAGIPTVVVRSGTSTESFFASGVASSSFVGELVVDALDDIPQAIDDGDFEKAFQLSVDRAIEPTRGCATNGAAESAQLPAERHPLRE